MLCGFKKIQIFRDAQTVHPFPFLTGFHGNYPGAFLDQLIIGGRNIKLAVHAEILRDHLPGGADIVAAFAEIINAHGGFIADDLLFQNFAYTLMPSFETPRPVS